MSKGRKRAASRKGHGNQSAMGGGRYGNRGELEDAREYLLRADPGADDTELLGYLQDQHPALRGLGLDDRIDVIITDRDGQPEGAGEFLGVLGKDTEFEGGPGKAGWKVWSNAGRPSPPDQQIRIRDVARTPAGNSANSAPGTAAQAVLRAHPPGQGQPAQVVQLRAGEVLDLHTGLYQQMREPSALTLLFFDRLLGNLATQEFWARMFWPAATGREFAAIQSRALSRARTYQVSAEMTSVVTGAYERNAGAGAYRIRGADLPWQAGFAWLDKPLAFTDKYGRTGMSRVITWGTESVEGRPGARITTWTWAGDRDDYTDDGVQSRMTALGGLVMGFSQIVSLGDSITTAHSGDGPADGQDDAIDWTRLLWHTMSSEIATVPRAADVDRGARRRAVKSLLHDQVHVILLRRARPISENSDGYRNIRWSCRWPVQEFWRHTRLDPAAGPHHAAPDSGREHCAECGMKVSRVAGYIKGPSGLPIKVSRHVYRLAR